MPSSLLFPCSSEPYIGVNRLGLDLMRFSDAMRMLTTTTFIFAPYMCEKREHVTYILQVRLRSFGSSYIIGQKYLGHP